MLVKKSGHISSRSSESDLVRTKLIFRPFALNYTLGPIIPNKLNLSSKWGGGGGFEISDIPGRGEGVVCESLDVRNFLKKSKFQS